ncbi:MAG: P-II family nitrogen regulator [Pseudomonadota bacterium]|nr:P-II family nitrogen regulator [Pseudomonadota bacterium]
MGEVEQALRKLGIPGMSCSHVKGYGEYADFYCSDWLVTHGRIEIFTLASDVQCIVDTIMDTAHSGSKGDGIIAVLPVEHLYHIRTREQATTITSEEQEA